MASRHRPARPQRLDTRASGGALAVGTGLLCHLAGEPTGVLTKVNFETRPAEGKRSAGFGAGLVTPRLLGSLWPLDERASRLPGVRKREVSDLSRFGTEPGAPTRMACDSRGLRRIAPDGLSASRLPRRLHAHIRPFAGRSLDGYRPVSVKRCTDASSVAEWSAYRLLTGSDDDASCDECAKRLNSATSCTAARPSQATATESQSRSVAFPIVVINGRGGQSTVAWQPLAQNGRPMTADGSTFTTDADGLGHKPKVHERPHRFPRRVRWFTP
jgi:hypothetical protein